jgi:G3E family GTPase
VNGCSCCNNNDLDRSIQCLININQPDIIFAESAGSSTDSAAKVMKPLLQYRPVVKVTISTFADISLLEILLKNDSGIFDESFRDIYFKQLAEAGIIVVSKIYFFDHESLQEVKQLMDKKYEDKILLCQNSFNAIYIQQWLHTLDIKLFTKSSSLQNLTNVSQVVNFQP